MSSFFLVKPVIFSLISSTILRLSFPFPHCLQEETHPMAAILCLSSSEAKQNNAISFEIPCAEVNSKEASSVEVWVPATGLFGGLVTILLALTPTQSFLTFINCVICLPVSKFVRAITNITVRRASAISAGKLWVSAAHLIRLPNWKPCVL